MIDRKELADEMKLYGAVKGARLDDEEVAEIVAALRGGQDDQQVGPKQPPWIWCESCGIVKPLVTDELSGPDVTGHFSGAVDLMCGTCRLVIATTFATPSPSKEA